MIWTHWQKILYGIAKGLKGLMIYEPNPKHTPTGCIEVQLFEGKSKSPVKKMSLQFALEAIASDLTWDEDSDWSETDRAEVHSI